MSATGLILSEKGLLIQDRDNGMISQDDLRVVSERVPTELEMADMLFAWKVAKMVKLNAIVYAKDNQTVGGCRSDESHQ